MAAPLRRAAGLRPTAGRPQCMRGATRLASGLLLACAAVAFRETLGFVAAPGGVMRAAFGRVSEPSPWATQSPAERMEVPRGQSLPRTQMYGRYAEGDRSKKNNQGGGRIPIRVNRNPVLAYSKQSQMRQDVGEMSNAVLRRMWDMYDMDFNKMTAVQQRYFRREPRKKKWTADYNMRLGRRKKEMRIKRQYETDWQQWMRTEGRAQGLTDPIIFNGPPLTLTEEEDQKTDPEYVRKLIPSEADIKAKWTPKVRKMSKIPKDLEPGMWNDQGPDSIHKIWRRPLCKHPYDIGKRGKWGPVVRGIVM